MNEKDKTILNNIKKFNEFDLYSKEDNTTITYEIKDYYTNLLNDYFHGELQW